MALEFRKMHGCGNSFVLINELQCGPREWQKLSLELCDPHFGIGSDGLMVVKRCGQADFEVAMFNPDGSFMGMCGNGIRCVSRFVEKEQLLKPGQKELSFLVEGRLIRCTLLEAGTLPSAVRVDMGKPSFAPRDLPIAVDKEFVDSPISAGGENFRATGVSMGNPHCVIFVDDLQTYKGAKLAAVGPALEHHALFPRRTNVEFVKIINRREIEVAVWERGAGRTLACGTGACAAVMAAVRNGLSDKQVAVRLPGGELLVEFDQTSGHVFLTGPVVEVCRGELPNF